MKQCDGTLKFHVNTFKMLQKLYLPNDSSENRSILDNIKGYLEYLELDKDSKSKTLSRMEKLKIMANLTYFAEQYKYQANFNDDSKMMGRFRCFLDSEDYEILEKNDYFNLPKFKEWLDNADYDEYYVTECEYGGSCGKGNEPIDYSEWRKQHPKK